jgi:ABC-type nitrate/sulfonate/bicarbonate transport system permease component
MVTTGAAEKWTYRERLAVAWLLTWRSVVLGGLSGAGLGFVVGIVLTVVGADLARWQLAMMAVSASVSVFAVLPMLVVPMMVRKKYGSFTLEIHHRNI